MSVIHHGFAPIVTEHSRVLILGTFPGRVSREKAEYYGNPRNAFWEILAALSHADATPLDYTGKCALLQSLGIALWDIIASCETEGSLDSEIRGETLIDLHGFLAQYPAIRAVAFNGGNAAKYAKRLGKLPVSERILPSTSPANARLGRAAKLQRWQELLQPFLSH